MSDTLVKIAPKKGSKHFFSHATVKKEVMQNGETKEIEVGEYRKERFPKSRQIVRPKYSFSQRRWMLSGMENGPILDKLVKACAFQYVSGKNKGDYIESANINDINDAFFNHPKLRDLRKEGQSTLNLKRPLDQLLFAAFKIDPKHANGKSMLSSRAKYEIKNDGEERAEGVALRRGLSTAVKLFDALTFDKKKKVAIALGLTFGKGISPEWIDDQLWSFVQDNKTMAGYKRMTKQAYFIHLCESDADALHVQYSIALAMRKGIIRRRQGQGFMLAGEPIGKTKQQAIDFLNLTENQDMLIRLEELLEQKELGYEDTNTDNGNQINQTSVRDSKKD